MLKIIRGLLVINVKIVLYYFWFRIEFFTMFRVRTDVSEQRITFIIRVERISDLGTTLAVSSN
jgi:hypothetical protein